MALPGRAEEIRLHRSHPHDPVLRAALREWDWTARGLLARGAVIHETRLRLEDGRRIQQELSNVLDGVEPGEGTATHRNLFVARAGGRIQAVASMFTCPRAVFVELVATAPWNLLAAADPEDARTVRGAGSTLVQHARTWSLATGRGGRVALQAENPRCRAYYEHHGFERMTATDRPFELVPPGDHGFSPEVRRVAEGREGPAEEKSPWMLLDPARLPFSGSVAVPPRAVARGLLP